MIELGITITSISIILCICNGLWRISLFLSIINMAGCLGLFVKL